jgi:hypothetical protein
MLTHRTLEAVCLLIARLRLCACLLIARLRLCACLLIARLRLCACLLIAHLRRHALALAVDNFGHEWIRRELGRLEHDGAPGRAVKIRAHLVRAAVATALPAKTNAKRNPTRAREVDLNGVGV